MCLKPWNMTRGNFFAAHTRRESRDRLSGDSSSPSMVLKTGEG